MKPLVIIIWLLLGLGYFFLDKNSDENCCVPQTAVIEEKAPSVVEEASTKSGPLVFSFGSDSSITSNVFSSYRDSILATLKENQKLEIVGLYRKEEGNISSFDNLGIARAEATKKLFVQSMDAERILTSGRLVGMGEADRDDLFTGTAYKYRIVTEKIKEIDEKTLIYFAYNSTNKFADAEVESYLNDVAERVKASGESIQLVGHADSFGDAQYNYKLGMNRAKIVRSYLMSKGVSKSKIEIDSKGESAPLEPNTNREGRAKNRRTELVIK